MQAVIDFLVAHQVVLASALVALVDLAIAVSPKLAGNGILHQIYLALKGLMSKPPQA